MRARRAIASVALAAAMVLVAAAWSARTPNVRHASVQLRHGSLAIVVDVWRDASTGELAFRMRGADDLALLRGRTIFGVIEGRLGDVTVYSHLRDAWKVIRERYGLTAARTNAVLAAGETVRRPALLAVPKPDPDEYTLSLDFGTDIAALRHAARFAVPSPGRRLDGRVL